MSRKILVIDDEKLVTKTLQKLLKKEGYEAVIAQSGQEALEHIKQQEFGLIVSDVRMPEMDGVETISAIREYLKQAGKPAVPELLITGYADEQRYKNAVELKVAGYIYKPFDKEEFLEAVKNNIV